MVEVKHLGHVPTDARQMPSATQGGRCVHFPLGSVPTWRKELVPSAWTAVRLSRVAHGKLLGQCLAPSRLSAGAE